MEVAKKTNRHSLSSHQGARCKSCPTDIDALSPTIEDKELFDYPNELKPGGCAGVTVGGRISIFDLFRRRRSKMGLS